MDRLTVGQKLSPERRAAITAAVAAGESAQAIADRFGVSKMTVYNFRAKVKAASPSSRVMPWAETPKPEPEPEPTPPVKPEPTERRFHSLETVQANSQIRSKATKDLGRLHADAATADRIYDDEESEYLHACEAYARRYQRKFMRATDYLAVIKSLGYRQRISHPEHDHCQPTSPATLPRPQSSPRSI